MSERTIRHTEDGPPGYRRFGTHVQTEPGDEISVDADLAEAIVDQQPFFEFVDDSEKADGGSDGDDGPSGADSGPAEDGGLINELQEMTIDEFEDELEMGRFDDRLEQVVAAEEQGKDRAGIYDAVGVRRAELEG